MAYRSHKVQNAQLLSDQYIQRIFPAVNTRLVKAQYKYLAQIDQSLSIDWFKNGEGGIRTHEGVTPTRFRVVRDQPDSATSPHALGRFRSLKADDPGTHSMLQKPSTLWF